ncbi:hypothetical protein CPB86DRAFT_783576 [Serendipita vermifera]|nr:hypothetical protein CPB86DRAFT_783576 [Serendipita vermifera]
MYNLAFLFITPSLFSSILVQGAPNLAARQPNTSSFKEIPSTWNLSVPLNFGAYLNDSFTTPNSLALEFTNPKLYANFWSYGGGPSYTYDSSSVTTTTTTSSSTTSSTSSRYCLDFICFPLATATTTTPTPTPTQDLAPNPVAFLNRPVGGAPRNYIYGSSRWGSGFGTVNHPNPAMYIWVPYDTLAQPPRSNPFGFWPIYWGSGLDYYEYSTHYKSQRFRPGGAQSAILASRDGGPSYRPYWYIIADSYTINGLNTILKLPVDKGGCGMYVDGQVYDFDADAVAPNGTRTLFPADGGRNARHNLTMPPQSAVQYYRASSVVLGTPPYVNTYALNHNHDTTYWGMTPWNITDLFPMFFDASDPVNTGINMTARYAAEMSFLNCLNTTIAAAVPIINPDATPIVEPSSSTSKLWWVGVSVGVGIGGIILLWVCIKQRWLGRFIGCLTGKPMPSRSSRRRVPLGRHTGGPRVVFTDGEILPDYSREPIDTPSLSYAMTERESDAQALTQTLLPHRRTDSRAAGDEELPPPYSPATASPTGRR